jgi:hypothetical protein
MKTLRALTLSALLACTQAHAHHGISNWDLNKDITLTGRITGLDFLNPHAWLKLEVKNASGRTEAWSCEMRSAYSLRRSGWTTDMFKTGSTITVIGSPERTKPRQCYLSTISFTDGSSMDRYGQRQLPDAEKAKVVVVRAARTADGKPNLAGDWSAEQRVMNDPRGQMGTLVPLSQAGKMKPGDVSSQQSFPGARGSPASLAADPIRAAWDRPIPVKLTATGRKAVDVFNPATRDNPRLRCEPTSILFDWGFDSVTNRIEQSATRITMRYGHMDLARTIHLDRKAVPPNTRATRAGYSIGRWEGDTLVVDTTHFLPGVLNADSRILHGTKLRVTERFELDPATHRLLRRYEAVDPEYFEDTWRGADDVFPAEVAWSAYSCKDPGGAPGAAATGR